ncbi:tyrosine-type recombinase/integrase [Leptospira yasudae]|uniref:Recombinase XerC n=1 Tax=Leptospira yasudae TaxID=2202201 RepID=A0ABX9LY26_9LEPT|nr:tyrosine-type recombinase/integrase [Leptospira yasudae]RHX77488.1 recombinase XerC [Leptospira yasudae]
MSIRSNLINLTTYRTSQIRVQKVENQVTGQMLGKGLTDQTMMALIKSFSNPQTEKDYRNRSLLSLLSKTGLRAKEIVSLRFSNIFHSSSGEKLVSYLKKGGLRGYAVISDETFEFIKAYHSILDKKYDHFILSLPRRNHKLRSNLSTRGLQLIVNSWGVKTCSGRLIHPHALRHTVGAKLLETSGSIAAQKVLGHSTPVTTSKYYTKPYFDGSKFLTWE